MKLALLALTTVALSFGQVPYQSTQGNVTIYIMDWSNHPPVNLPGMIPGAPTKLGIMMTVCTTDRATQVMHSVIKYRKPDGTEATRIDDAGRVVEASWANCATTVLDVERKNMLSITIEEWKPTVSPSFVLQN